MATDTNKTIHQGRNVKRFREMLGLKQEALAEKLGGDWTQRKLSYIETREVLENDLIHQLADALKVPAEAILNFDEEKAIFNIQNNYEGANTQGQVLGDHNTYNSSAKHDQFAEENKKLYEENRRLYEELLRAEREKNTLLERILNSKGT